MPTLLQGPISSQPSAGDGRPAELRQSAGIKFVRAASAARADDEQSEGGASRTGTKTSLPTGSDQGTGKRQRRRGRSTEVDSDLLTAMVKLQLQTCQNLREVQSVVLDVYIIKASDPVIKAATEQGQLYADQTRGKKGHTLGPPTPWIFGAILTDLAGRDGVGAKNQQDLKAYLEQGEGMELHDKIEAVPVARITKLYDQEMRRVILSIRAVEVRRMLNSSMKQLGADHKLGKAPPGGLERLLQEWLDGDRRVK